MTKNNSFFELLCLNDQVKIKEFIISNGKGPKPVCPIILEELDFGDQIKNAINFIAA